MNELWAASLTNLSYQDLYNLAKDAETRIGSHVVGGNTVDEYVLKQQHLLDLIQKELENRIKTT